MDNQQESSEIKDKIELAWLAGIYDGEGTITIRIHRMQKSKIQLKAVCSIVNTDMDIIDEIERILKKNNVPHWVNITKQTGNWKARKQIDITGLKRTMKFLPLITEYLIGKKEEAKIVMEFCENRTKEYSECRNSAYYTDKDLDLYKKVKALHGHQDQANKNISEILRDYTRNIRKDEDIVRTA